MNVTGPSFFPFPVQSEAYAPQSRAKTRSFLFPRFPNKACLTSQRLPLFPFFSFTEHRLPLGVELCRHSWCFSPAPLNLPPGQPTPRPFLSPVRLENRSPKLFSCIRRARIGSCPPFHVTTRQPLLFKTSPDSRRVHTPSSDRIVSAVSDGFRAMSSTSFFSR